MRRLLLVLPLVLSIAGGCIRSRPKTPAQPASLDVPPPPARVVVPPEPEEPPDEQVSEPSETTVRRPTRPRQQPSRERAETKPPEAAKEAPAAETARPPATTPVPLGPLQPVLPASPGEMERRVNDQLVQAKRDLDRVDYRALGTDGKSQYDTAKRFIEQAGQALKDRNFLFAAKLAEKAVGLASGLVAR